MYVGTLSRYYCGEWETILQQSSANQSRNEPPAANPTQLEVSRKQLEAAVREVAEKLGGRLEVPGNRPAITDRDRRRVQKDLEGWRKRLAHQLKGKIPTELTWNESSSAPYFTDKPGWESYGSLLLWAAHEEHPEIPRPESAPTDWTKSQAWQASAANRAGTRYGQLISGPEVWLPLDFSFTFEAEDLAGKRVPIGSSVQLLRELKSLNDRTWLASENETEQWMRKGPDPAGSLEGNAQFGYAVLSFLGGKAVAHRLPMKLDY